LEKLAAWDITSDSLLDLQMLEENKKEVEVFRRGESNYTQNIFFIKFDL